MGIAQSSEWMLHASGHQMEVVVEPVRRAVERIAATHGEVTAIKRIPGLNLQLSCDMTCLTRLPPFQVPKYGHD